MKKILFASTALVAAGLMSAGEANAADKIKLNLGGFSKWWVVGAWQSNGFTDANGVQNSAANNGSTGKRQAVDVKGDNEIWFDGSTTLDNGLKVGVHVELEAGGHTDVTTDVIDQSYAFVEGGFGKIQIGTLPNTAAQMHVQAPDAAGNAAAGGMMTGNYAILKPGAVTGMNQLAGWSGSTNTTGIITDDNAEKVAYITPSFGGLQLGATYVPNIMRQDNRVTPVAGASAYVGSALYANTFGGVGVKASVGYLYSSFNLRNLASTTGTTGDGIVGWQQLSLGTQVSYAGFTVGGSYQKANQNNRAGTGISASSLTGLGGNGGQGNGLTAATGTGAAYNGVDFGGTAWDAGIQYATGPYSVSFNYYYSEVNGQLAVDGKDKIEFYQVSGKYNLSAGVDLLGSIGYASYIDETHARSNDGLKNEGVAAMTGLSLAF